MKYLLLALAALPLSGSADTIYHCKGYDGGTFWADTTCSKHKALIDRIANVPSGMSWDQQVAIAEGQRQAATKQVSSDSVQSDAATRCAGLKTDRDKIWSRYSNWQYQAPEVVGSDRQRTLAIQAQQRALGCSEQ
ncbi:MAG: hypothetical protein Q7K20_15090 [Polaromonas sp.]|nr:hypothetical protein [Polaromonas sp.]